MPQAQTTSTSPARIAMGNRNYVTFGPAYIRDILAGTQRDTEKQISHAIALRLGTQRQLRRLQPHVLLALLAAALSKPTVKLASNAKCVH
jgi:hypothetical protein